MSTLEFTFRSESTRNALSSEDNAKSNESQKNLMTYDFLAQLVSHFILWNSLFLWLLGLPLCQWCHAGHAVWAKSQASICQWCSHCIQILGKLPMITKLFCITILHIMIILEYIWYYIIIIISLTILTTCRLWASFPRQKESKTLGFYPPRPWNWWNPAL